MESRSWLPQLGDREGREGAGCGLWEVPGLRFLERG